jgi:hypothetical protein
MSSVAPAFPDRAEPASGRAQPTRSAPMQARIAIAVSVALIAFGLAFLRFRAAPYVYAGDFTWHWRAGRALLDGASPYRVINTLPYYPYNSGYYYLLPTAVIVAPFAVLTPHLAAASFVGCSLGLLAFALTRDGYWRLPLLASLPVAWCVFSGQVVALATAAILLPALWWLWPLKYTLGAAGAAYQLSGKYLAVGLAVVGLSMVIWPWWPHDWLAEFSDNNGRYYRVPLLVPGGVLLLVTLLRWRRPEARLIAAMACVPQTMLYYDQLPLALAAKTYRQALWFSIGSYVAPLIAIAIHGTNAVDLRVLVQRNAAVILTCYYAPAAFLVLLRPNIGQVPRWLERASKVLPARLRGSAT